MSDILNISKSSVPPSITPTPTLADQLADWKTSLLSSGLWSKLFKNNVIVSASTTLLDLTEATAPGYTESLITDIDGPYLDQEGGAYMSPPKQLFTTTGGGTDLIYGEYIVQQTGAEATVTFTLTGGQYTLPVVGGGGSGYIVAPTVRITGATGSGAAAHAEITGGVVTSVVIDNPGTGYTTATATIDPPTKLVQVANFLAPLPLENVTDSIQFTVEFDNPPV
jgi:hypothetical protein